LEVFGGIVGHGGSPAHHDPVARAFCQALVSIGIAWMWYQDTAKKNGGFSLTAGWLYVHIPPEQETPTKGIVQ
jgi:hypothetical protein